MPERIAYTRRVGVDWASLLATAAAHGVPVYRTVRYGYPVRVTSIEEVRACRR